MPEVWHASSRLWAIKFSSLKLSFICPPMRIYAYICVPGWYVCVLKTFVPRWSTAVWCVHLFTVCSWWNVYVNIVVACHIRGGRLCPQEMLWGFDCVCGRERVGGSEHVLFRALRGKTSNLMMQCSVKSSVSGCYSPYWVVFKSNLLC